MKKELYSGTAFITLTCIAGMMGLFYLSPTLTLLETPTRQEIMEGRWSQKFEKAFGQSLPAETASRNLWGRAEYAAFRQGRKGVIVGKDGWLFTDEEFSCPSHAAQNLSDNLAYIVHVREKLREKGAQLTVLLLPAKARVYPQRLPFSPPPCHADIYANVRDFLTKNNITVTDLLPAIQSSSVYETLYLKTDTHWSPAGSALAAQAVAPLVPTSNIQTTSFTSHAGVSRMRAGDLTRYIPGVKFQPDPLREYATGVAVASTDAAPDLFDDAVPPVTLIGTSYSANPSWNFAGFLKEALKMDVLNMADEGLGPFTVMDKYLANDALKNNPPKIVVWEMPERYFVMHYETTQ